MSGALRISEARQTYGVAAQLGMKQQWGYNEDCGGKRQAKCGGRLETA